MKVFYQKEFVQALVGRTITGCIHVEVGDGEAWPGLELDDGSLLVIQRDPEGNGGGFMSLADKDGKELGCGGVA